MESFVLCHFPLPLYASGRINWRCGLRSPGRCPGLNNTAPCGAILWRERIRWIEGIQASQKLAEQCPETTVISLSDSEGDIYELFVAPRTTDNFHFIVRAGQERAVLDETGAIQGVILA